MDEKDLHSIFGGSREFRMRKQLYNRSLSTKGALKYTYLRNYVAAEWVGRFGWILDLFIVIIASILLYVLTKNEATEFVLFYPFSILTPTDLAIIILIGSLLSTFYGPKLRSRDYYNAGQELHQLHDQVRSFIEIDLMDTNKEISKLRETYEGLEDQRHRLNQSTPQLGGHWYRAMEWKQKYKKWVPWEEYREYSDPDFETVVVESGGYNDS
ncbi:hypothetical protein [Halalkalicoccus subterraneus]|uniref:hypothetical protein n=1 Tax=Halalkalicoccus subterraneus TaxID=2675002 RepID=UPI0013CEAD5C|nr:hypothetical protein [Halalkalicoccus subterraneus]